MGKLYWTIVSIVVISGLTTAIYFGLEGKTVPVIKWSHFANADEVSGAIQTRLTQELRAYQIYFIGPHPQKPLHIQSAVNVVQWLRLQNPESILITDTILTERNESIKNLNADLTLDLGKEKEQFLQGLEAVGTGRKVIVLAPNIYVTHYIAQSPMAEMQDSLKDKKYVALTFVNFPQSREEESNYEFPCKTFEGSGTQLDFGCFVVGQSRRFYRKSHVEAKVPGFLNLVRSSEYMFFLGK